MVKDITDDDITNLRHDLADGYSRAMGCNEKTANEGDLKAMIAFFKNAFN